MAGKTAIITLAGDPYTVHAFNIGELEEISELLADADNKPSLKIGISILQVALKRSEPPVDVRTLEGVTIPELNEAAGTLLELAGIKAVPQQAEAPAA